MFIYIDFLIKKILKRKQNVIMVFYLLFRNSFYLCDERQFSKNTKRFTCFSNKNV